MDTLYEIFKKAKIVADDKEFQRARMAHVNGARDKSWLDFFYQAVMEELKDGSYTCYDDCYCYCRIWGIRILPDLAREANHFLDDS